MRRSLVAMACTAAFVIPRLALGATGESLFSDVQKSHPALPEIEFLVERGIISGNPDGTFRPDEPVSRAAAVKMIVSPLAPIDELWKNERSSFADVTNLDWYFPYIEYAFRNLHIIDGPPVTANFVPSRTVKKAEFLKMLFLSDNAPIEDFVSIRAPFAMDALNMQEWYIPYAKYAVAASLIPLEGDSNLQPGQELSRADAAVIVARYIKFKEGDRTQELLDQTEEALVRTLEKLGSEDIRGASTHSVRAMLTAYGASRSHPLDPLVQATVKIAEGFWFMLLSWHQIETREWQSSLQNSLTAATRAEQARTLHDGFQYIVFELEKLIETMSREAQEGMHGKK